MSRMFHLAHKRFNKRNLPALGERVDASFIALLTGCTRQHLTRLCRSGKVPNAYQSKGGHWRARWSRDLAHWIASNQRLSSAAPASIREQRLLHLQKQSNGFSEIEILIRRMKSNIDLAFWKVSMEEIPTSSLTSMLKSCISRIDPLPSNPKAAR